MGDHSLMARSPFLTLAGLLATSASFGARAENSCAAGGLCDGTFELTYFDGRGLAEVSRTLLVTSGRFPGEGFEDVRLSRDEFDSRKGTGDLAKNLNRVPILNHNGHVIGQSAAINRYLARVL